MDLQPQPLILGPRKDLNPPRMPRPDPLQPSRTHDPFYLTEELRIRRMDRGMDREDGA